MASTPDPYAECLPKYEVHPEAYEHVRRGVALGARPYSELDVDGAREQATRMSLSFTGTVDFSGSESEVIVPSPDTSQGIPVSVYKPDGAPSVPAIFIYFHGGGHVIGSRATVEACLKKMSQESGAIFLNVEYRLLPNAESNMASFDDSLAVARWVLANKEAVGGHANSKVGVGGDSAGGHLAVSVTNDVTDLDFQVLVYPLTDVSRSQASFSEFTITPGLTRDAINFFFTNSVALIPDANTNPRVNPAVRTNMASSPPALFILAELDALRNCGLEYADKLRAAGVSVECHLIKGVPHAFFHMCDCYKTKTAEAYAHIIKFVKQFNQ